jgi:hypothetical protein
MLIKQIKLNLKIVKIFGNNLKKIKKILNFLSKIYILHKTKLIFSNII